MVARKRALAQSPGMGRKTVKWMKVSLDLTMNHFAYLIESKNTENELRVGTVTRRGGNRPQYQVQQSDLAKKPKGPSHKKYGLVIITL